MLAPSCPPPRYRDRTGCLNALAGLAHATAPHCRHSSTISPGGSLPAPCSHARLLPPLPRPPPRADHRISKDEWAAALKSGLVQRAAATYADFVALRDPKMEDFDEMDQNRGGYIECARVAHSGPAANAVRPLARMRSGARQLRPMRRRLPRYTDVLALRCASQLARVLRVDRVEGEAFAHGCRCRPRCERADRQAAQPRRRAQVVHNAIGDERAESVAPLGARSGWLHAQSSVAGMRACARTDNGAAGGMNYCKRP